MRIRLGILDSDVLYKNRFINYFNANYADSIELFSFSELDSLLRHLRQSKLDVLLAAPDIVPDPEAIPTGPAFAYWAETIGIDSINNVRTVCKYQKAELIYKELLGLYAETDSKVVFGHKDADHSMVLSFLGAAGGVGASTVAAGAALYFARRGKRVIFLDTTCLGQASIYFQGEGGASLSEVMYAIKSNHANLFLKLESMVKRDSSGVRYYDSFRVALDGRDSTPENFEALIEAVSGSGSYDVVVVDAENSMGEKQQVILNNSSAVVVLSDGTTVANQKVRRLLEAIHLEKNDCRDILNRTYLLYNRFHTGGQKVDVSDLVNELGGINAYKNAQPAQIAAEISNKTIFDVFLKGLGN